MSIIDEWRIEQIIKRLDTLQEKMAYDREQTLTHAQRNMNHDWNVSFIASVQEELKDLLPKPVRKQLPDYECKPDDIPF